MLLTNQTSDQVFQISRPSVEQIRLDNCDITLKRFEGADAVELYLSCKPSGSARRAREQTVNIYRAALELLAIEGGNPSAIIAETLFIRDIDTAIDDIRAGRESVTSSLASWQGTWKETQVQSAITEIQQPPLDQNAQLEVMIQAVLPYRGRLIKRILHNGAPSINTGHHASKALLIEMGDEHRLIAGSVCGDGDNAYEQSGSMFEQCEKLLHQAGMEFTDVVRTWIYLREMERDYPSLNKARREFFDARGIDPVPASTGIEGGMVKRKHDLCIGFYAVKSANNLERQMMTSPTLNEAGEYGADFTRGMRMRESNKVALHVSGTASIDEAGNTAHIDDVAAQIDRMILNLKTLLENQGADFKDILYAYNYLKDPADEQLLRKKFKEAGFEGFPSIFVHAEVCRPDLLCETEVFAALPHEDSKGKGNLKEIKTNSTPA